MAIDLLEKASKENKLSSSQMTKRVLKYVWPEKWHFIIAFIIIGLNVALEALMPQFLGYIMKELNAVEPSLNLIIWIAVGYFAITLVTYTLSYIQGIDLQKTGQKIIYKLRMEVFNHIESMSQNQFNNIPVGSLVTRVTNYTSSMSDLFTNILVNLIKNILTVIVVFIMMLFISVKLSLIELVFFAVVFGASYIFRRFIGKIFRKERNCISDINTFLSENLSGMKITQIFNQESTKDKEFLEKNENLRKARYQVTIAFAIYRPFITLVYSAAICTNFILGMNFKVDAVTIVTFYLYISRFFNPVQSIADQLNGIQKANTACEKLFNLLDIVPEIVDEPEALEIDKFKGKIEFRNVWFAYENENWILKNVSFIVYPGQTAAFVGATGAGKTTILGLIVKNYQIQKGEILIDDININNIKTTSLRKHIGQMLQDVFLFNGTLRSNITLHDESYSDEQILKACNYVNASSFINKENNGLDKKVIERGENFSQGQRQLISFARTVLHKPDILILDEATANIDTETEVLIQDSLEKMRSIGTMLIVAHRLSTIQKADQIICLQKGEIVEIGNHQSLLKLKGYYYKLYKLQFENK